MNLVSYTIVWSYSTRVEYKSQSFFKKFFITDL